MRKAILLLMALALLGAACAGGGDTSTDAAAFTNSDECGGGESIDTFDVTVTPDQAIYRIGRTGTFTAKVVRHLAPDADVRQPRIEKGQQGDGEGDAVEDATVALNLRSGDVVAVGAGVTDEAGIARITVRLPKNMPAGMTQGSGYAWKAIAEGPCVHLAEDGSFYADTFVEARK